MIPTIVILSSMLNHHADTYTDEVADGIDRVCESVECQLDAVATCWIETRCLGENICGKNGCGPFQQVRRYTDIPELEGLSYREKTLILQEDTFVAAKQWKSKRDSYRARHGKTWPVRYNGTENAEAYYRRWQRARSWAQGIEKRANKDYDGLSTTEVSSLKWAMETFPLAQWFDAEGIHNAPQSASSSLRESTLAACAL